MSSEKKNSGDTSAGTSQVRTPSKPHELTEDEYLARQVEYAQAAMHRAGKDLASNLGQAVNVAAWTRRHPVAMVCGAAAAGVLTAGILRGMRRRKVRRGHETADDTVHEKVKGRRGRKDGRPSIAWWLVEELIRAARPAVVSAVTTAVAGRMAESGNGHVDLRPNKQEPPTGN